MEDESYEAMTRRQSMDSEVTIASRKSSSDLDESFLNKRDLKYSHKNASGPV